MPQVRVHQLAISLDGYATGADQSREAPFGHAGTRLMEWFFPTRLGRVVHGDDLPGRRNLEDALVSASFDGTVGAEIMGRGKFYPHSEPWPDDWRGWWGEEPPFRTPVFVLTHHTRPPLEMKGGTTFHFVDASPEEALAQATEAAGGLDVRIGGGPTVVREFLRRGLVDHMHVVLVPLVLGRGVRLWDSLEGLEAGYDIETITSSASSVTHMLFHRKG